MVVVFSGGGTAGHFHPARNIAEALAGVAPGVQPYFVGTEGRIEAHELPRLGYDYRLLAVSGLRGSRGGRFAAAVANLGAIWLLLLAVARLVPDLRRRQAAAAVLTGGYVCAAAGIAARLLGIPVVLQEQNRHPGKTTRLLSRWARQIHLAYPEAGAALPRRARSRIRDSGNPIRPLPPGAERSRAAARRALGLPADASIVLVVGGSQGARKMNSGLIEILQDDLPIKRQFVLWITGRAHHTGALRALGRDRGDRFAVVPYLEPARMYQALAAADLAVSRAGAMATSEFLAWGLPSILIPLPTAAADHQSANARALAAAGAALHLPETAADGTPLTGARLWDEVSRVLGTPGLLAKMSRAAMARARPDAARDVAVAITELIG